ncbi:SGNH/GDSL hydrolase family protein [Nakamurella leprariae]|uniref:SGNH/GDSL hydrolase family protein n=1 Tax=Nakamurella leprariae TaxID=2803911 RepID=A0A939C0E3_9ACTN|nr:SGNH/GDSL hydrolase family protein [Nakamurella leprariae]MBM9469135.1 SGNH/GDSL hydrolase family protein [Nakamurella leprariae]
MRSGDSRDRRRSAVGYAALAALTVGTIVASVVVLTRPTAVPNVDELNAAAASRIAAAQSSSSPATTVAPLIGSSSASSTPARPEMQRVVFIGDGYTAAPDSWAALVAASEGWTPTVLAAARAGYSNAPAGTPAYAGQAAGIPDGTDIVMVAGGGNDLSIFVRDPATFQADVAATLSEIGRRAPDATVIVVNPWWDDDPVPQTFVALSDTVRAAAVAAGATYLDTGQPLVGRSDLVDADSIRPNEQGQAALAAAVHLAIESVGAPL